MDEKTVMERRYSKTSSLPLYKEKQDSSSSTPSNKPQRRFLLLTYLFAFSFVFFFTFRFPGLLRSFYPRHSPRTVGSQPTHARSNETSLVPLEAHISRALFVNIPSPMRLLFVPRDMSQEQITHCTPQRSLVTQILIDKREC